MRARAARRHWWSGCVLASCFALGCDSGPNDGSREAPAAVACDCAEEIAAAREVWEADRKAAEASVGVGESAGGATGTAAATPTGAPGPATSPPTVPGAELADRIAAASRKMMHDDGRGCLDELDAVRVIDPKMDARMDTLRGQCEMLVGECQAGKQRVATWYIDEMAMTPERARDMAESLASMRCRDGDSTDRDRLLRALYELTDGAYVNARSAEFCSERVALVLELGPKVEPRDVDDTQVTGGRQALFQTGASCMARAGDCEGAFRIYADNFPETPGSDGVGLDPALREQVVRQSFESSVSRCGPDAKATESPEP